jgi:hypothetical protein
LLQSFSFFCSAIFCSFFFTSSTWFFNVLGDGERDLLDLVPDLDLGLGGAPLEGLLDGDLLPLGLDGLLDGDLLPLGLAGLLDDDLLPGDLDLPCLLLVLPLLAGVLVLPLLAGVLVLPLLAGVLVLALTLGGGDGDAELRGSLYLPLLIPAFTMPVGDLVDLLLLPGGGGDALLPGGGGDAPLAGVLDLLPALTLRAACWALVSGIVNSHKNLKIIWHVLRNLFLTVLDIYPALVCTLDQL